MEGFGGGRCLDCNFYKKFWSELSLFAEILESKIGKNMFWAVLGGKANY